MRATNLDEAIEQALDHKSDRRHVCLKCRNAKVLDIVGETPYVYCAQDHWGSHALGALLEGHPDFYGRTDCPDRTRE